MHDLLIILFVIFYTVFLPSFCVFVLKYSHEYKSAPRQVPQPAKAVLMLFPINEATEKARIDEEARLAASGQQVSPKVWFTKQTIGNACGTIGLLHATMNNAEDLGLGARLSPRNRLLLLAPSLRSLRQIFSQATCLAVLLLTT